MFATLCSPHWPAAMKIIVVAVLIAIIVALFSALVFLYRDAGRGKRVVWLLTMRVALSVSLRRCS